MQIARPGDVVLCPPDVKRRHEAGLREDGERIAVAFEKDGKNVTWLEHISEDEYKRLIEKADAKDAE